MSIRPDQFCEDLCLCSVTRGRHRMRWFHRVRISCSVFHRIYQMLKKFIDLLPTFTKEWLTTGLSRHWAHTSALVTLWIMHTVTILRTVAVLNISRSLVK